MDGKHGFNLLVESEVQAMVVYQRDIDARKAVEVENQRRTEELASSNLRLEEFAYTAAHDLREPLRAISLYIELVDKHAQMDPETKQLAEFALAGAARMSALIDDRFRSPAPACMNRPGRLIWIVPWRKPSKTWRCPSRQAAQG